MSSSLEARGRAAGAAVRRAADGLVPDHGSLPARGRRRLIVMPALGVLAVIGVVLASVSRSDGEAQVVAGSAGDLPRLVLSQVPVGLTEVRAVELPPEGSGAVQPLGRDTSLRLYGRSTSGGPFAGGDLGLFVSRGGTLATDAGESEVRTVRGRQAVLADVPDQRGLRSLSFEEVPGLTVVVASRSEDDDALVAFADDLEQVGDSMQPAELDDGFHLVAEQRSASVPEQASLPIPPRAEGHAVSFIGRSEDAAAERYVIASVHAGSADHLIVLRWWFDGETRTIRGHEGVLARREVVSTNVATGSDGMTAAEVSTSEVFVLAWEEADGVLVTMASRATSEEELLGAARSLREASDEEWQDLLSAAEEVPGPNVAGGADARERTALDGPTTSIGAGPVVVVPDVGGLGLAAARAAVAGRGLRAEVEITDATSPGSTVVAQEPPAGARVERGAAVGLRTAGAAPSEADQCPGAVHPLAGEADLLPRSGDTDLEVVRPLVEPLRQLLERSYPSATGVYLAHRGGQVWSTGASGTVQVQQVEDYQLVVELGDEADCPPQPTSHGAPVAFVLAPPMAGARCSADTPTGQPGPSEMDVLVFFSCGDGSASSPEELFEQTRPASRRVVRTPSVLAAALEALVAGPTRVERGVGFASSFSSATAGSVRGVNVEDGLAIVDLTRLPDNASTSAGSAYLLAELRSTVFQFPSVTALELRLEGSCEAFNEALQASGCRRIPRP